MPIGKSATIQSNGIRIHYTRTGGDDRQLFWLTAFRTPAAVGRRWLRCWLMIMM
ncbi:MAG: hypothetical protein R3E79_27060 [Caldilineaceae bacterium]